MRPGRGLLVTAAVPLSYQSAELRVARQRRRSVQHNVVSRGGIAFDDVASRQLRMLIVACSREGQRPVVGRVSQIERGEVTSVGVLVRYADAVGGRLRVIIDFGDELIAV